MTLRKANNTGNTVPYKFESKGDTIKGYYIKTTDELIDGNVVKKHFFDTAKGVLTVLGQANLYRQLQENDCLNKWVEATFTGEAIKIKGNKTMKMYDLFWDPTNIYSKANSIDSALLGEEPSEEEEEGLSAQEQVKNILSGRAKAV